MSKRELARLLTYDIAASLLLGVSIVVFTVNANFAPGGVSGLAVILNYLFAAPIGLATVIINIPIVVFTFRRLGAKFFLCSVKTTLINAFFIDYVVCRLPAFTGSRMIAAILAGVTAGMAYSLVFNVGSSTGGTDFIIAAINRVRPDFSFGRLAFLIDGAIIVGSVFVFQEPGAFIYGLVYTIVTSLALDATTWGMKKLGLITI